MIDKDWVYDYRPTQQDAELPDGDLDRIQAARSNPGPPMVERIAQEWREDVFAEQHRDCDAHWVCYECGRKVCPRCDPSPAEFIKCAECAWFTGGAA